MNGPLDPEFLKKLTTRGILPGDDDGGGETEGEEDIGEEEEESEERDSGYGSQGQIKKPVSYEAMWIIDG